MAEVKSRDIAKFRVERWNESDEVVSQDQSLKATQMPKVLDRFQAILAQVEELNMR